MKEKAGFDPDKITKYEIKRYLKIITEELKLDEKEIKKIKKDVFKNIKYKLFK